VADEILKPIDLASLPDDDLDFGNAQVDLESSFKAVDPASLDDSDLDFSNAQVESEVVFDDKRGQAFDVQPGLSGRETEYVIGTEFDKKDPRTHFGLTDLAVSLGRNLPKGVAAGVLELPISGAQLFKESIRTGFDPLRPDIMDINPLSIQKMSSFVRTFSERVKGEVAKPLSPVHQGFVDSLSQFQKDYSQTIADFGVKPDEGKPLSKFFFDVGRTGTSVLASVGALYATKNPAAVGILFGALDASETLQQAEAAGIPIEERLAAGALVGAFTAWTEGIGGEIFLRSMKMSNVLGKAAIRIGSDSAQEMVQQAGQGAVHEVFGIEKKSLMKHAQDIFYAGLLGAIGSGPVNIGASFYEKHGFIKSMQEAGVSKEAAIDLSDRISTKMLEDPQVMAEVKDILAAEFSPVSMSLEERKKALAEVEQKFEEELLARTGQDITKEQPDKNIAIEKVIRERRLTPQEVDAFPDLADFQNELDRIDEQLETAEDPDVVDSLTKRREALMAPFEQEGQAAEKKRVLEEHLKDLRERLSEEFAPLEQQSLRERIREAEVEIKDLGKPLSKAVIREAVGMKEADAKMVSESKALKRSLKRQEQTARDATRAERRRIETAQKLIRSIKKAAKDKNIAIEEKQQIDALASLLKKAKTVEDLRQLANKINELRKQGRDRVFESKELKRARFDAQKTALLTKLGFEKNLETGKFDIPVKAKLASTTKESAVGALILNTLTPTRIFDLLDGGADFEGIFNQIFYQAVNSSQNYEIALGNEATIRGVDILKRNEIKSEDLNAQMEVDGLVFSIQEAMYIYAGFSNEQTRRAIVFGNRISPQTVEKIINRLSQKFKNAADELVAEMSAHFPRLQAAFINLHDGRKELKRVAGPYLPMIRKLEATEDFNEELSAEIEDREFYSRGLGDPGFTKERKEVKGRDQKAINLNLWDIYNSHVSKREKFIGMQGVLKELKGLMGDSEIREGIRQKHGAEMVKEIDDYIERVAFPSAKYTHGALEKLARGLRQRTAVLHLPLNVMVMANQLSALPLFLGDVGPTELVSAFMELNFNFGEKVEFITSIDPQMKFRNVEKSVDEFLHAHPEAAKKLRDKIAKVGFQGIEIVDKYVVYAGWLAKFNQMRKLGFSERQAADAAQRAVLRTQNASLQKDVPSLYAKSEFLDTWLLFTNQLSKMYNQVVYDIPMRWRSGRREAAMLGAFGMAMSYVVFWSLTHGRLPDSPEEFAEALLDGSIGQLPLVGPILNSLRKGFDGTPAPIQTFARMAQAPFKAWDGLIDQDFGKILDSGAFFVAGAFKLPYTGVRRTVVGLSDLATGEADDLRRLIYTERALEETT